MYKIFGATLVIFFVFICIFHFCHPYAFDAKIFFC